jgi:hypothetical protein
VKSTHAEALDKRIASTTLLTHVDIRDAAIKGAVQRLRPKLMTVSAVLASLVPILWESGIGSDVMKPIAAPIVGGMVTSTIHVLIPRPRLLRNDERARLEAQHSAQAGGTLNRLSRAARRTLLAHEPDGSKECLLQFSSQGMDRCSAFAWYPWYPLTPEIGDTGWKWWKQWEPWRTRKDSKYAGFQQT